MKERIYKLASALFLLVGIVVIAALIEYYLPSWVYYSCVGLFVVWFLYEVSKPSAKGRYWYYTSIEKTDRISLGFGVMDSDSNYFDFALFYSKYPKASLIMVKEISKEQFDELNKLINKNKEEGAEK